MPGNRNFAKMYPATVDVSRMNTVETVANTRLFQRYVNIGADANIVW